MAIYGPNIHEKAVETAHTMLLGPKIAKNGYFWTILAEKPLKFFLLNKHDTNVEEKAFGDM